MCQIADTFGDYGITFWVVAANTAIALGIVYSFRKVVPALATAAIFCILTLAYGLFRLNEHTTAPGPRITVIQSNYPQSNEGIKGRKRKR